MKIHQNLLIDEMKLKGVLFLAISLFLFLQSCTKKVMYKDSNKIRSKCQIHPISKKKNGTCVYFNYAGDTLQIEEYQDGKLNGYSISFFENGKHQTEEQYRFDKKNGITKEYYKNGHKKITVVYDNDRLMQVLNISDSSGNILTTNPIINGNGEYEAFYPDGRLKYKGEFSNGYRSNWWLSYTQSGEIIDSTFYDQNDTSLLINEY